MVKGWKGKPKGLEQVLWEHIFINLDEQKSYKLHSYDSDGHDIPKYSLVSLMKSCNDFREEISQLQSIVDQLGVKVYTTTKYHVEIVGEGIEYEWGAAKSVYRKVPVGLKRGKVNFHELVRNCVSVGNVLTKKDVRRFAMRARCYMQVYNTLGKTDMKDDDHYISYLFDHIAMHQTSTMASSRK